MIIRGWREFAGHYDRSVATVKGWIESGCPLHGRDGNVHLFDTDMVDPWVAGRAELNNDPAARELADDDDDLDGDTPTTKKLLAEKIQKLKLDNAKAQHEAMVRDQVYAPVADFERAHERALLQIRETVTSLVEGLKSSIPELSASRAEDLDRQVSECFQKIARL